MRQHARYGVVDRAAKTAALRGDINEGYRPLFDACVLIHSGLEPSDPTRRMN
jgi:hypothetical protein